MIVRARLSSLRLICLGVLIYVMVGLALQGCRKRPSSITSLPGTAGYVDGRTQSAADLGAFASGNQELWILARGENPTRPSEQTPGSGALLAKIDEKEVPMPLKHTDVRGSVSGYI